jgi:hypothetical protein
MSWYCDVHDRSSLGNAYYFHQGKPDNFAHPALKEAIIRFFYTGSYWIADKRSNLFRKSVPLACLALVGAAVRISRVTD